MRIARQNISNSIYPRLADTATFSEKSNLSCKEASNNWQWKFQIPFQINRWYLHNGRPSWCEARSCGCDLPLVDCCQRAVLRLFYFQKCIRHYWASAPQTRTTRRGVTDYKPFNPRLITLCQSKFNQLQRCRNTTNDEQKYSVLRLLL